MKRLVLLPLLLLVGCGTPEPAKPTPQQLLEVLNEENNELMTLMEGITAKQLKFNRCVDYETLTAAMDMSAAKWGAMGVVLERMGDLTEAVQAKAAQRKLSSTSAMIRRQCR